MFGSVADCIAGAGERCQQYSNVTVRFVDMHDSLSDSEVSLPRYVSSECLPDWRTYAAYDFENLVMSGGGSKGYAYIGALKVTVTFT